MGPYKMYEKPTGMGKVAAMIPQPIKVFGSIALGAALTVFLAPALVVIFAPPLIMGWIYYRRRLRQLKQALHDQRWSDMSSYSFNYDGPGQGAAASESIPYAAKSRIYNAIERNEQDLGRFIGEQPDAVTYTPVESLYQDFKSSNTGHTETIQIQQFGMLNSSRRRVATVSLVVLGEPESQSRKMRIEITPLRGKAVVLTNVDHDDDSNVIIDVK